MAKQLSYEVTSADWKAAAPSVLSFDTTGLKSVSYEVDAEQRFAWITLNRPHRYNAIDNHLPHELMRCVTAANVDERVRVILVRGKGDFFCAGYDLKDSSESTNEIHCMQKLPWDPAADFAVMGPGDYPAGYTRCYMSLFNSRKPTIALVHGGAVAGGSDIALCCDFVLMTATAKIGYPPTRLWGVPTTAMWAAKCGMNIQQAKYMMLTGSLISGVEAEKRFGIALRGDFASYAEMEGYARDFAGKMAGVPANQLWFNKAVLNRVANGAYGGSIEGVQEMSSVLDGASRHTPEGIFFSKMAQRDGFKKAVQLRDSGKDIQAGFEGLHISEEDLKPFMRKGGSKL